MCTEAFFINQKVDDVNGVIDSCKVKQRPAVVTLGGQVSSVIKQTLDNVQVIGYLHTQAESWKMM